MKKDFVIRGQTASTAGVNTEVLEFGGHKEGYAYKLIEFELYPSTNIGETNDFEGCASITAGKTGIDPQNPNFNDEGLIGTSMFLVDSSSANYQYGSSSIVNDTFLITQNLILQVHDSSGGGLPVNWHCRFESVKMADAAAAVTNFKQFSVFDG
jgi:hypothetical protein